MSKKLPFTPFVSGKLRRGRDFPLLHSLPQHFGKERHGGDSADEEESPADRFTLFFREQVAEEERHPGAEGGAGAGDEGQFGHGESRFFHGINLRGKIVQPWHLTAHAARPGS